MPGRVPAPEAAALWRRARDVFEACIELDPPARERLAGERCGDDTALRRAVADLLRSHDALTGTLDDRFARGIGSALAEAQPGQRFGAFRIVGEIGRGGMGVVYLAERDDGTVEQRVALKLVAGAQIGPEATARLARERRLLASLEHACIARLIDAGAGESGDAYFAMEYVQGEPITRWCDARALPLAARLGLFLDVCSAVQHAHAQLVVHRDIKAANVLIRDDGLPKLLDFGIATSLGEAVGAADGTHCERRLSPHAAAPEQWDGSPIGVAVDVYALGVLLCELAGGARPFDVAGLAPDEAARRVLHDAPRLPSAAADDAAAGRRGLRDARALRRQLHGDLDAIVARCLAKQPGARYASVAQLADDVTRHLQRRPLLARAGEPGHRGLRFLQRNALAVTLGTLVFALVAGFALYGAITNRELARERDQARQREREAVYERARAQGVTDFLVGLFTSTSPEQRRGREMSVRELVDQGRAALERESPLATDAKAAMLAALSDVYAALDDFDAAERLAVAAAGLRRSSGTDPRQQVDSLLQLAAIAVRRDRATEALASLDEASALLASNDDDALRLRLLAARTDALHLLGRGSESVAAVEQARALALRAFGAGDARAIRAGSRLANAFESVGRVDDARALLSTMLPTLRRSLPADDPALADALLSLARYAQSRGELDPAARHAAEALSTMVRMYGEGGSRTVRAVNMLASIEGARGNLREACRLLARALDIQRSTHGRESTQTASAEYNLGMMLQASGSSDQEALAHLEAAVEIAAGLLPADHVNLAIFRLSLGASLRENGRIEEAATTLAHALAVFEAHPAPRGLNRALTRAELACIALARNRSDAAARSELARRIAQAQAASPGDLRLPRLHACLAEVRARPDTPENRTPPPDTAPAADP